MFGRNVQTQTMTANAEPTVHVVMGDPLLSRVAELYREGLAEAGVEGARVQYRRRFDRWDARRFTWWWRLRANRPAWCMPRWAPWIS